jgi:D-sedoheptulose 7-phosphate isomerase/D-glycero-D-manno-heptose 1,7-bisphosphate phosphatase
VISSSGNSKNILKALDTAKALNMFTIALVGFEGGQAKDKADISLHVNKNNYGIVEDAHQALMHTLAQYIRRKHLQVPSEMVKF